ncbi:MAG: family metallo-hydrolase, partial [Chitinophagaceae bacterium]|nr:family metallo-hydrolase [Chitinophagaceae bacterium]
MRRLTLLLCFFALGKANAQDLTEDSIFIKRISDNILSSNDAYENLRYLTKNIGHRLAGSRAMVKSEQWGLQTMKKYYPAKVYFQQCMVPHWVRGGKDMAALTYIENGKKKTYALDMLALGNSLGSGDKGVTAPLIVVTSFKDLEEKKDLVKGKIVFYNIPFEDSFPD